MSDPDEVIQRAVADAIREDEGRDVELVIRTVTVAEVLMDGNPDPVLVTLSTGDMPTWAALGLLRGAAAVTERLHVAATLDDD